MLSMLGDEGRRLFSCFGYVNGLDRCFGGNVGAFLKSCCPLTHAGVDGEWSGAPLVCLVPHCADPPNCNVCDECCHSYILPDKCDACVKVECTAPTPTPTPAANTCNPPADCDVCKECCHPYILNGELCDGCVDSQCPKKGPAIALTSLACMFAALFLGPLSYSFDIRCVYEAG